MFIAELEANKTLRRKLNTVRTGVAAGSAVPAALLEKLNEQMGMQLEICYGMTETSPVTFMTSPDDPKEARLRSLGKVMPHTMAKIVDSKGNIVPRGQRGELCTAGFALQKGYWKEKAKTDEVMRRDENGVLWMHTGDECYIDEEGFCHFESRLKDVIIRGIHLIILMDRLHTLAILTISRRREHHALRDRESSPRAPEHRGCLSYRCN